MADRELGRVMGPGYVECVDTSALTEILTSGENRPVKLVGGENERGNESRLTVTPPVSDGG